MKKSIQLGLVLVALSLYFMRTREGFDIAGSSEPKCPDGNVPQLGTAWCGNTSQGGTDPTCPEGFTEETGRGEEGLGDMVCRNGDTYTSKSRCPSGKVFDREKRKCFDRIPVCPANTKYYVVIPESGNPSKAICVPNDVKKYNAPQGLRCTSGDIAIHDGDMNKSIECVSAQEKERPPSEFREVIDSLKPFRPPTAPASDLEKERKEITNLAKRDMFFVQAALFLVVLSMLSYFMFSLDTANLIAFALLCVGIAMGFFLRR